MLGVFLFLTALVPGIGVRQGRLRVVAAGIGLACVYFSQVRTGLIALAIGVLVLTIASGSLQRWVNRLLVLVSLVILGLVFVDPLTTYASQFTALRTLLERGIEDTRFTHRFTSWSTSLDMIDASPFTGYGSGSAGDTLGPYFAAGEHVTSHNTFMRYAVEGGVLQAVLVAVLCVGLLVAVRPSRDTTYYGLIAGTTFLVFAFVGAAPESLPIAFGLAVTWGLCAFRRPATPDQPGAVPMARLRRGIPA
jgi:O-antigen ligase